MTTAKLPIQKSTLLALLIAFASADATQPVEVQERPNFVGWIPVQQAAPGSRFKLDLKRYCEVTPCLSG